MFDVRCFVNTIKCQVLNLFGHVWSMYFNTTWNPKHPFNSGCFNWMIPILYIGNGCFTKHPIKNGCLEYQEDNKRIYFVYAYMISIMGVCNVWKLCIKRLPRNPNHNINILRVWCD